VASPAASTPPSSGTPTASKSANVIDSSAWLEYFADGPNAESFAPPIEAISRLIVPTIALFEVYKRMDAQRGRAAAQRAVAQMMQGRVVNLDAHIALTAAQVSRAERLPMADSIILTTARLEQAELWTQDDDFEHVPGVRYYPKVAPT
jgi:predicted nucleic acid-binding protein